MGTKKNQPYPSQDEINEWNGISVVRAPRKYPMETHYEISVWNIAEGDVVEKRWDASEEELEELREWYEDDPTFQVVIDREWEEPAL